MAYQDFNDLGDKIQDLIDQAIDAKNYQKLNQSISQAVNRAIDTGSDAFKDALNNVMMGNNSFPNNGKNTRQQNKTAGNSCHPEHNARAYETHRNHAYQQPPFGRQQNIVPEQKQETALSLYGRTGVEKTKGILMTTFGGIISAGMGTGFITTAVIAMVGGQFATAGLFTGMAILGAATGAGIALLTKGCQRLGSLGRFRHYVKALGRNTYCSFEQLSRAVGKPVKYVKKDIKAMITRGWFLEGHVDRQETCLITSNDTYRQYEETIKQLEERQKAADPKVCEDTHMSPETREIIKKGNEYLVKIRKNNDAIPGEEISAKISRLELIAQKIFQRAQEHPEVIPDLKRLMDYYLPMTIKLLDAYEDMDSQPIQGENIRNSKREIEQTLDTLNIAFEKILDSIFKDTAWDVSSDISVLNTVLAQEGLTEDDFQRMKKKTV